MFASCLREYYQAMSLWYCKKLLSCRIFSINSQVLARGRPGVFFKLVSEMTLVCETGLKSDVGEWIPLQNQLLSRRYSFLGPVDVWGNSGVSFEGSNEMVPAEIQGFSELTERKLLPEILIKQFSRMFHQLIIASHCVSAWVSDRVACYQTAEKAE